MVVVGSKEGDQGFIKMPEFPQKQDQESKIVFLSFGVQNIVTKNLEKEDKEEFILR